MNAAIIAAIMAAQRNTIKKPQNTSNSNQYTTKNIIDRFLLLKGDHIAMKISETETIISSTIHGYFCNGGYKYSATLNKKEITAPTIEECIQRVVETSHAKEIQLIPRAISNQTVSSYLILLKVNKKSLHSVL